MSHTHKDDGPCEFCEAQKLPLAEQEARVAELREQQLKWVEEHGFYAHWVAPRVGHPEDGPHQSHTHGLVESFSHPDLQIKFPLQGATANSIFHTFVNRIKSGEKFYANQDYEGILTGNYKVRLIPAVECGRPVLRIIIPPKSGELDREKMHEAIFEEQYDDLSTN